jgi:glycosyltransferase involved in cell wall biosynthesis
MKSSNKGVAMFSLFFEPLSMGGAETQAKRLSQLLLKQGTNVFFVTSGIKGLPASEVIGGVQVYRYFPLLPRIKKPRPVTEMEVIFDYSQKQGTQLLYASTRVDWRKALMMADNFFYAFRVFWKHRKEFSILQINTLSHFSVTGALIGMLLGKKVIIKDSTMDGIVQMQGTPFPAAARRFLIRRVSIFVAMTRAIAENYRKFGVPEEKIAMIPNGIDAEQPIPAAARSGTGKCLFVGNLYQQPAKGIDILLKAWPDVQHTVPSATLTIVGDGNIAKYRQHVESCGLAASVTFTGKQNPRDYYLTHDLFVLPSRREGMSNALMEAMLYALPVVATDISGNQDLITDDGGRLTRPNDTGSLAAAVIDMLLQPARLSEMGLHNRTAIMRRCSLSRVAELYSDCYKRMLEKPCK